MDFDNWRFRPKLTYFGGNLCKLGNIQDFLVMVYCFLDLETSSINPRLCLNSLHPIFEVPKSKLDNLFSKYFAGNCHFPCN